MNQPPPSSMWEQFFENDDSDNDDWWWNFSQKPSPIVLNAEPIHYGITVNDVILEQVPQWPDIMLESVVEVGEKTPEGHLIQLVTPAWGKLIEHLSVDKDFMFKMNWRVWEEMIAATYKALGYDVILTPRANDQGIDVIASRNDVGSIRFFDQMKAYARGRRVSANDCRAMLGVLNSKGNVSKGIITTTAQFAPGIENDPTIAPMMPYRLQLRDGDQLLEWLKAAHLRK